MANEEFCTQGCGCGEKFWKRYFASNEIEKVTIIKSLPIFHKLDAGVWIAEGITPVLLNSYITDAADYLIGQNLNFSEQTQQ